jgi:hypothetical protein
MPKLQVTPDGTNKITIPIDIVKEKEWKKGANIGFCVCDNINYPLPGDIFLRKNR